MPTDSKPQDLKRQNFNVTPEQEAELAALQEALAAPSVKDAILRAVRIVGTLSRETRRGAALVVEDAQGNRSRLVIPELEGIGPDWQYLVARPHPWRRELSVKGRRLLASVVWSDIQVNGLTLAEAADNWRLPVEAVQEIVRYCQANPGLLEMEAEEERRRLNEAGIEVGEQIKASVEGLAS